MARHGLRCALTVVKRGVCFHENVGSIPILREITLHSSVHIRHAHVRPWVLQGFGMTETNAITTLNSAANYVARPSSCGRAVLNVDVAIFGDDDAPVATGAVGEVVIRGPTVMRGTPVLVLCPCVLARASRPWLCLGGLDCATSRRRTALLCRVLEEARGNA